MSSVLLSSLQNGTLLSFSCNPGANSTQDTTVVKRRSNAYMILAEVEFLHAIHEEEKPYYVLQEK